MAPGALRGVARCVWRPASEGPTRIVPDGCVDLVVGGGAVFVAGPDTAAWSSVTAPGVALTGVRFVPGRWVRGRTRCRIGLLVPRSRESDAPATPNAGVARRRFVDPHRPKRPKAAFGASDAPKAAWVHGVVATPMVGGCCGWSGRSGAVVAGCAGAVLGAG
ncbi:DUF6597 domain-containing transcriptional factor, partial [Amycolatopsis sp. lyj-109]|uniref:DUF6597 domain-containing transcriptional factor n=1 Tax=Amycolatopsis sp. lyj-109 TaxID=2789287 RepID=UPI00397D6D82